MKNQEEKIIVRNARVNNLKIPYLTIPKNKLVVITGVSGSGKSSLAFDTIYAEAERRFVESLSSYARQFLGIKEKPDVDSIDGLSPAIAIDQRSYIRNPRSTVGTTVGIYDYLRILFSQFGQAFCPICQVKVEQKNSSQIAKEIKTLFSKNKEILIFAPIFEAKKGEHKNVISEILNSGFPKVAFDNKLWQTGELLNFPIDKNKRHTLEVLVDDLIRNDFEFSRLADSIKTALKIGKGYLRVFLDSQEAFNKEKKPEKLILFSEHFSCPKCGFAFPKIEPRLFSFNSPYGACQECSGLGILIKVDPELTFPNKNLTLAEGAIKPWATASHRVGRQSWYWYQIQELADKYNFSVNMPIKDLPKKVVNLILYGDEEFEGVINNLERRWKESPSEATKEEIEKYMTKIECPVCRGERLKPEALAIKLNSLNIAQIAHFDIEKAEKFFADYKKTLSGNLKHVIELLVREIEKRLGFLKEVGLKYLTLSRESTTLSGGEAQRVRLATQISSGLSGIIYVLDEPSAGLHPADQARLIKALKYLRDLNNTVIVVEHDSQTMRQADWLLEIGPGAGENGGKIVFEGTCERLLKSKTLTGEYLAGKKKVFDVKAEFKNKSQSQKSIALIGAGEHNLKNINIDFPLARLIGVSGVSGSGKSSLIVDTLGRALMKYFYNAKEKPGIHKQIKGLTNIDKVVIVDQSPIGRTPRSNPATYTSAFSYIRDIFAKTEIARMRGYEPGHFSFNVKGGRCSVCEGEGYKKVEMYFLPDVYVECEECQGARYSQEVLEIEYNAKNIGQVLNMSAQQAHKFFKDIPILRQKLNLLEEVGLGYIKLGQAATTLSGGEAQRIKLSKELSRRATGKTLYILDEPTFGLHFDDIRKLISVLKKLVQFGNTVIVIEHNPEFLQACDWLIDLGPEGGNKGGKVIFQGTPSQIKKSKISWTGKFLTF